MHSIGKHASIVHYVKNMAHLSFQCILHFKYMPRPQKVAKNYER